jgi:hypothetical protein
VEREFHADREMKGRTERMKIIVAFCNFATAPKNSLYLKMYESQYMTLNPTEGF